MTSSQIETLENAYFEEGYPFLHVEVNGRPTRIRREKALRFDGQYASLGDSGFYDFYVIIPPEVHSPENPDARPRKLEGYTSDPRYVALVWKFVDAVDGRTQYIPGHVEIPR